ncbi:MAG: cadmium-translocating P-type ATPase [Eggerthellaceae bacterium]|nr:cadmium-translocating P-type ATPase [Eggerthellaceae bacterium]
MTRKQKTKLIRIIVAAVLTAAIAFSPAEGLLAFGLYLIPYLIVAYDILLKAAKNIARGQVFDENFLMAVASIGALAIGLAKTGDFLEAVAVILFYQVGELFESIAVGRSRKNIAALMDIRPDYANVEGEGGELVRRDPDEVPVGSVIVINPGERVPLDGVILSGTSTLDTSALTGESVPRDAAPGNDIISGCINLSGVLRVRTTKAFGESTVAKILDLVENASSRKSRSEAFISRFARIYTPAVCGAALALALLPPLVNLVLGGAPAWSTWIYRALVFLVISCPCALVISIPLSFFAGLGGASRAGILVKGSNYLEALSKTGVVVFDKTGTLTRGSFEVVDVRCAPGFTRESLLEAAALAESASSHPIAQSLQAAFGAATDRSRVAEVTEVSGRGVRAKVDGRVVLAGSARLMEDEGVAYVADEAPGTVVYVAVDGAFAGSIRIADTEKPESAEAIRNLKALGITDTVMLTGDVEAVAADVAGRLGVGRYFAGLLPADKVAKVEEILADLRERGSRVKLAFVGDGINDAPVLSRADIGVAMGALGSDAAIEAADVVLMDDDPRNLARAIRLARKCMGIVYQNIVFAIGIKFACLVLGALGIANMWLAIFADVGVMVLAVLNAMRCLRISRQ